MSAQGRTDLVDAAGCFVLLLNYIVQLPYVLAKMLEIICAPQERDVHVCVFHSRKHIAKTPLLEKEW
jgi:hypothetical protein